VDKKLVLILGGARSGKSAYAERVAADLAGAGDTGGAGGAVLYVATARALDEEMSRRIARHRAERPPTWRTLEEPLDPGPAIERVRAGATVVLLDCVTLWLSNLLLGIGRDDGLAPDGDVMGDATPDDDAAEGIARVGVERLLAAHASGTASTVLVSNEVGMGVVPPYPLGRLYRDLLGRVNARLAAASDEVVLMVAGLPLRVKQGSGVTSSDGPV